MHLIVHTVTRGNSPAFPPLKVKIECEDPVSIDYFNIGLLTDERTVFTFPLSLSSHRQDNATLAELSLHSSSQTVTFEQMPSFTGLIPPRAKHLEIGVIKIFARKKAEKKSVITLRARIVVGNDEFWTEQKLFYQEIRTPISAGAKRFIDLRKLNPKKERFPLKNNLNVPLFLTKFSCDESVIQLSWTGERRKMVYPNHSIDELSLLYVGPKEIPISPQKHVIML